jgi:malto-oligosyltrehalose trehalohydrolase
MQSEQGLNRWGALRLESGAVRFRLWASGQQQITLKVVGNEYPMTSVGDGWFEQTLDNIPPGAAYHYQLADGTAVPDPASRAQQGDVNGPSRVVEPHHYTWQHPEWRGRAWEETVVYELHIGTFTPEGTFRAAIEKLPYLAELGITQIEVMPVAQTGGNRNWGYDGVLLYAPHSAYGTPEEFKALIDAAHGLGLSVVLDIVLNHFGPA